SCKGFRAAARGRIRKWHGRWGTRSRCGRWRGLARQLLFRLWAHAIASSARTAAWRGTGGECRGRNNCWRRNGRRAERRRLGSRTARGKNTRLLARLNVRGVFRPVWFEFGFADLQVLHHIGIFKEKIVAGTRFEEFLLHGQP